VQDSTRAAEADSDNAAVYAATGDERLVAMQPPLPLPDTGSPLPALAMTEGSAALSYSSIQARVVVRFRGVESVLFGAPNEEALEGHPLHDRGLDSYRFVEVENSPWIAELERANRVHERHSVARYSRLHHFILPFHDSSFECVAEEFEIVPTDGDDVLAAFASRL
jgi:hypothetical protein